MLPGTELAFADNVKYDNRWIWTRDHQLPSWANSARSIRTFRIVTMMRSNFQMASTVLVTQLCEGQRVTVLQLPVIERIKEHVQPAAGARAATPLSVD